MSNRLNSAKGGIQLTWKTLQSLKSLFVLLSVLFLIFCHSKLNAADNEKESKPTTTTSKQSENAQKNKAFLIKLNIQHGHIGHVFIGCSENATDDFDNQMDDMSPPPGMGGVGYTFLISPDRKYNLYKDIRAFADTVQWVFYAKIGGNPVTVSWDPKSIPSGWDMYCSPWDGKSETVPENLNCKKATSIKADKTGFFRFWVVKTPEKQAAGN